MNESVNKMLAPEETALLQDIMAGLQAMLMSNSAGPAENPAEGTGATVVESGMAAPQMNKEGMPPATVGEEDEEDEAQKSDNGPTANPNDKAEDRVEDGTVVSEDNLGSISKLLAQVLIGKAHKNQAAPAAPQANTEAITEAVSKALKPVVEKMSILEKDQDALLSALGVAEAMDTVEKAENPVTAVQKALGGQDNAPVLNPDAMSVIGMVAKEVVAQMLGGDSEDSDEGPRIKYNTSSTRAHKSLGSAVVGAINERKGE